MESGHVTPFGAGECDFFDANGRYVPKKAAHLTDIIVGYEKAQARACKAVPNCWTDNGTGSSFREEWAYFEGADNVHMNTTGLSKLAEHMWPAVEAVLRAPTQ
jgi:lysophospholipase L1-like esterase